MQLNELVKKVMKVEHVSQIELSERMGKKRAAVGRALSRQSIAGDYAVEMLEILGYELIAVKIKKETARECVGLREGEIENVVGVDE